MPGGDRTGPRGMGAMTGRAAGFCGRIRRSRLSARGRVRRTRSWLGSRSAAQVLCYGPDWLATGSDGLGRRGCCGRLRLEQQRRRESSSKRSAQAEAAAATLDQVRRRLDEIAAAKQPSGEGQ